MKFVLHLKHWQLFILTFVLPVVLYMVFIMTVMANVFMGGGRIHEGFEGLPTISYALIAVTALTWLASIVIKISWLFNVATGLHKKLPPNHTMKIKRFYFAFFYPAVYITCFCLFMFTVVMSSITTMQASGPHQGIPPFVAYIFLIIPLHILAIACIFYVLYFIAKSLKSVEMSKEPEISEYVAEFVLLWFSFIGIWFIQPRINKIFSEEGTPTQAENQKLV